MFQVKDPAMAISVHCDVVSAEESIFSGEVEFGVFPGEAGELGILPHHTPLKAISSWSMCPAACWRFSRAW